MVRIVDPVVGEGRVPDGEAACVRKDHCPQFAAAVSNLGVFNGETGSRHRLDAAGPFVVRIVQEGHGSESGRRIRTDHERSVDAVQLALLHNDVGDNDRRPPAHTHPSPFSGRRRRIDLISKTGFALHANVVFPSATDSMETFLLMRIVSFAENFSVSKRIEAPLRRQLTTSWNEVPDASIS